MLRLDRPLLRHGGQLDGSGDIDRHETTVIGEGDIGGTAVASHLHGKAERVTRCTVAPEIDTHQLIRGGGLQYRASYPEVSVGVECQFARLPHHLPIGDGSVEAGLRQGIDDAIVRQGGDIIGLHTHLSRGSTGGQEECGEE